MVLQWVAISQKPCGPAFLQNILAYPCGRRPIGMIRADLGFQKGFQKLKKQNKLRIVSYFKNKVIA